MIKLNGKVLLFAALLCSSIGFASCSSAPGTNNGNAVVVNANNKPANSAPANTAPANDVAKTDTTGDKVGVAECDEYITKMEACFTKVPEAQRAMVKSNFDTMKKSWRDAASTPQGKSGLASGCKAALDSAKQSYSYCAW